MHTTRQLSNTQHYRFRRWTRKAYAVFASLHRVISIGALVVSTTGETLLSGINNVIEFAAGQLNLIVDAESDDADACDGKLHVLQLQTLPILLTGSEMGAAAGNPRWIDRIYNDGFRGLCLVNRFFYAVFSNNYL